MLEDISPCDKEALTKEDLWSIIVHQEEQIEILWTRIDDLIDLIEKTKKEDTDAINYWRKNYKDALNMGLGFKESCVGWRHRYEELKYGKRSD